MDVHHNYMYIMLSSCTCHSVPVCASIRNYYGIDKQSWFTDQLMYTVTQTMGNQFQTGN